MRNTNHSMSPSALFFCPGTDGYHSTGWQTASVCPRQQPASPDQDGTSNIMTCSRMHRHVKVPNASAHSFFFFPPTSACAPPLPPPSSLPCRPKPNAECPYYCHFSCILIQLEGVPRRVRADAVGTGDVELIHDDKSVVLLSSKDRLPGVPCLPRCGVAPHLPPQKAGILVRRCKLGPWLAWESLGEVPQHPDMQN